MSKFRESLFIVLFVSALMSIISNLFGNESVVFFVFGAVFMYAAFVVDKLHKKGNGNG